MKEQLATEAKYAKMIGVSLASLFEQRPANFPKLGQARPDP